MGNGTTAVNVLSNSYTRVDKLHRNYYRLSFLPDFDTTQMIYLLTPCLPVYLGLFSVAHVFLQLTGCDWSWTRKNTSIQT